LEDPKYEPLRLRLEAAHSAVEAAMVEARATLEQAEELRRVLEELGERLDG
jgi:hypothetical protein